MTKLNQIAATDAFVANVARINSALAALQALADNHLNADADAVNWALVGSAGEIATQLENTLRFADSTGR